LAELGVSRAESKRWQQLASVDEVTFCQYLDVMKRQSQHITASGLQRLMRQPSDNPYDHLSRAVYDARTASGERPVETEDVSELANHLQLLADVLQPFFSSPALQSVHPEVRVAGQLLAEMGNMIQRLTDNGEFTGAV
jgi:hypothetical protein